MDIRKVKWMKTMTKLLRHFRRWNLWRKRNLNGRLHHFLVLIRLRKSPTLALVLLPDEQSNISELTETNDELARVFSTLGFSAKEVAMTLSKVSEQLPPIAEGKGETNA